MHSQLVISSLPLLCQNLFLIEFFCGSFISKTIYEIGRNIKQFKGHLLVNLVTNNMKAQTTIKDRWCRYFPDGQVEAHHEHVTWSGLLSWQKAELTLAATVAGVRVQRPDSSLCKQEHNKVGKANRTKQAVENRIFVIGYEHFKLADWEKCLNVPTSNHSVCLSQGCVSFSVRRGLAMAEGESTAIGNGWVVLSKDIFVEFTFSLFKNWAWSKSKSVRKIKSQDLRRQKEFSLHDSHLKAGSQVRESWKGDSETADLFWRKSCLLGPIPCQTQAVFTEG